MISIQTGEIIEGDIPAKQLKLIQAWAILHESELLLNFEGLRKLPVFWKQIEPLQ
jgi:hypothetical protein